MTQPNPSPGPMPPLYTAVLATVAGGVLARTAWAAGALTRSPLITLLVVALGAQLLIGRLTRKATR